MILEFMHAFMRETDEGLTLKQVFQVILFHSRIFKLLLFTAVTHKQIKIRKLRPIVPMRSCSLFSFNF